MFIMIIKVSKMCSLVYHNTNNSDETFPLVYRGLKLQCLDDGLVSYNHTDFHFTRH